MSDKHKASFTDYSEHMTRFQLQPLDGSGQPPDQEITIAQMAPLPYCIPFHFGGLTAEFPSDYDRDGFGRTSMLHSSNSTGEMRQIHRHLRVYVAIVQDALQIGWHRLHHEDILGAKNLAAIYPFFQFAKDFALRQQRMKPDPIKLSRFLTGFSMANGAFMVSHLRDQP